MKKEKTTYIHSADDLKRHLNETSTFIDEKWVAVRPIGYSSFTYRLKAAWKVFTGQADVIKWYKQ